MGAMVAAEPIMTESLSAARADEKIEEQAKEMEKELGGTTQNLTTEGGVEEVPNPGESLEGRRPGGATGVEGEVNG